MAPAQRTRASGNSVFLALDNGNSIVSHGDKFAAGGDVHVLNTAGKEIGFWSWEEWPDDPGLVMGAIRRCAAGH